MRQKVWLRMNGTVVRVLIWTLALVALYVVLPFYAIVDALLLFSAAGVVPGTDTVLPPGQTIAVLSVVGVLTLLLLFRRELVRLFTRQPKVVVMAETVAASPAAVQPMLPPVRKTPSKLKAVKRRLVRPAKPAPVVVVKLPGTQGIIPKAFRAATGLLVPRVHRTSVWVGFFFANCVYGIRQAMALVGRAVRRGGLVVQRAGIVAGSFLRRVTLIGARKIRRQTIVHGRLLLHFAIVYWRRLRPHLERIDRTLEAQVKKNAVYRHVTRAGREVRLATASVRRQWDGFIARRPSND